MTYITSFKTLSTPRVFKTSNINYLHYYDTTLAIPTESGLPFIYTLTVPKLIQLNIGGSHKVDNSSTTGFMELTVAGHLMISEKIQSRIGFVAPFEHKHYIAGIDTNTQIFLPGSLTLKVLGGQKKIELKIRPLKSSQIGYETIHNSVVPYTARHDILSFTSIPRNDTRLVKREQPHTIQFSIENSMFAVTSDNIDEEASKKKGMEAFDEIYNVLSNSGAHYRTFDVFLYLWPALINVTWESLAMFDVNDDYSEATIPATFDKRPESKERMIQFVKEVSKDVNSATSYVYDISVLSHSHFVFTVALANSRLDNKVQILFYCNVQTPRNEEVLAEFCSIGHVQSSPSTPLNFARAIEEIPKYEFKAEMRFGNCANGDTIRLKGNLTGSDEVKEMAMKSEIIEKCRQEVKQGDIWLLNCQRASKLIRQKDRLMLSIDPVSDNFYMTVYGIIGEMTKTLTFVENIERLNAADVNKTIDMEIKMSDNNTKIFLRTSDMNVKLRPTDAFKGRLNLIKQRLEKVSEGCKL